MAARRMKGAWWVDFRYEGKRIRRRSVVNTKRGAEEYERLLRTRLLSGEPLNSPAKEKVAAPDKGKEVPKARAFLAEWVEVYAKTNNKPSEAYMKACIVRLHLTPFFGRMRLDNIGVREIDRYKAKKVQSEENPQGLQPKTINNHLTVLRRALTSAVEWGHIEHVPPIKWMKTAPAEFDFFTKDESDRLLETTEEEHLAMVMTAVKAGLRRGELMALRWEDVDFVIGKILVRRSVWKGKVTSPKNYRHREVPMSPRLMRALKSHRHLRGPLVFCQLDGKMFTKDMIKRTLPRACRKAGLRRVQWHALRHSFASQLVMVGVPLKVVQELLGHATIEMTMRYAHLAPSMHIDAVAKLDGPYLGTGDSATPSAQGK